MADTTITENGIRSFVFLSDSKEEATQTTGQLLNLQLTVERSALLKVLGHVQSVVERKNAVPILANVKIEAKEGKVRFTATDTEISISAHLSTAIIREGSVTVAAHTFYEIARKIPSDLLIMLTEERQSNDQSTQLIIEAGASRFSLAVLPASEFPEINNSGLTHQFSLPATDFKALIDKTRFAIATEEARYYLNGIYLHVVEENGQTALRAVATDGHRLARMEVALPITAHNIPGVIVPKKTIIELRKIIDGQDIEITVSLSSTKMRVVSGDVVLVSKLIEGNFPDYTQVIPTYNDKVLEISRELLTEAVDRVATISFERSRAVEFFIEKDTLVLSARGEANGTACETLEANYNAESLLTGFNARYILDMMSAIEGDLVRFVLSDGSAPAIVCDSSDPRLLYVVMPMHA